MEEIIEYSIVPFGFLMCLNRECSKSDNCLRQLVERSVPQEIERWNIVSLKYLAALTDDCPYYKAAEKVRFAKGFIQMLENLPYKQMQLAVHRLMDFFGRRMYYRVRKGERLLSPAEQQNIQNILGSCGVSQPQKFDAYIERYEW